MPIRSPIIGGKPHKGPWTLVGSGRLGIQKPGSDVDYMVPVESVKDHLHEFKPYKGVPGGYWKQHPDVDGRTATVVAIPHRAYQIIDRSYQQAVDRHSADELRKLRADVGKDKFYKHIGVVYTKDAVRAKTPAEAEKDMPFKSKRQQRAAFGGHIPGISKEKAKEWAKETPNMKRLPERAPAEKGKPTLRSKEAELLKVAISAGRAREMVQRGLLSRFAKAGLTVTPEIEAEILHRARMVERNLGGTTAAGQKRFAEQLASQGLNPEQVAKGVQENIVAAKQTARKGLREAAMSTAPGAPIQATAQNSWHAGSRARLNEINAQRAAKGLPATNQTGYVTGRMRGTPNPGDLDYDQFFGIGAPAAAPKKVPPSSGRPIPPPQKGPGVDPWQVTKNKAEADLRASESAELIAKDMAEAGARARNSAEFLANARAQREGVQSLAQQGANLEGQVEGLYGANPQAQAARAARQAAAPAVSPAATPVTEAGGSGLLIPGLAVGGLGLAGAGGLYLANKDKGKTAQLAHARDRGRGVAKQSIRKGRKVEMEHTKNPATARQIAIDHLRERPDYYERLEAVEKKSSYKMYLHPAALGTLAGGVIGAGTGALTAGEGERGRGALRGGLTGAAIGAGAGLLGGHLTGKALGPELTKDYDRISKLKPIEPIKGGIIQTGVRHPLVDELVAQHGVVEADKRIKSLERTGLGLLLGGGGAAAGGGALAGSTARKKPEEVKAASLAYTPVIRPSNEEIVKMAQQMFPDWEQMSDDEREKAANIVANIAGRTVRGVQQAASGAANLAGRATTGVKNVVHSVGDSMAAGAARRAASFEAGLAGKSLTPQELSAITQDVKATRGGERLMSGGHVKYEGGSRVPAAALPAPGAAPPPVPAAAPGAAPAAPAAAPAEGGFKMPWWVTPAVGVAGIGAGMYMTKQNSAPARSKVAGGQFNQFVELNLARISRGEEVDFASLKIAGLVQPAKRGGERNGIGDEIPPVTDFAEAIHADNIKAAKDSERAEFISDRLDDLGVAALVAPSVAQFAGEKMEHATNPEVKALGAAIHGMGKRMKDYHLQEIGGLALVAPGVVKPIGRGIDRLLPGGKKPEDYMEEPDPKTAAGKSVLSDHRDPPGYMMVSNLKRLADQSKRLSNAVSVHDDAEPWVESKIDRASESIDAVYDHMKYKSEKKSSHTLSAHETAAVHLRKLSSAYTTPLKIPNRGPLDLIEHLSAHEDHRKEYVAHLKAKGTKPSWGQKFEAEDRKMRKLLADFHASTGAGKPSTSTVKKSSATRPLITSEGALDALAKLKARTAEARKVVQSASMPNLQPTVQQTRYLARTSGNFPKVGSRRLEDVAIKVAQVMHPDWEYLTYEEQKKIADAVQSLIGVGRKTKNFLASKGKQLGAEVEAIRKGEGLAGARVRGPAAAERELVRREARDTAKDTLSREMAASKDRMRNEALAARDEARAETWRNQAKAETADPKDRAYAQKRLEEAERKAVTGKAEREAEAARAAKAREQQPVTGTPEYKRDLAESRERGLAAEREVKARPKQEAAEAEGLRKEFRDRARAAKAPPPATPAPELRESSSQFRKRITAEADRAAPPDGDLLTRWESEADRIRALQDEMAEGARLRRQMANPPSATPVSAAATPVAPAASAASVAPQSEVQSALSEIRSIGPAPAGAAPAMPAASGDPSLTQLVRAGGGAPGARPLAPPTPAGPAIPAGATPQNPMPDMRAAQAAQARPPVPPPPPPPPRQVPPPPPPAGRAPVPPPPPPSATPVAAGATPVAAAGTPAAAAPAEPGKPGFLRRNAIPIVGGAAALGLGGLAVGAGSLLNQTQMAQEEGMTARPLAPPSYQGAGRPF